LTGSPESPLGAHTYQGACSLSLSDGCLHVGVGGVEEFLFGFDVDEDFGYVVDVGEDAVFDDVGDGVAGADGDVAVDDDVEVDVVAEADLAHEALFKADDAGDQPGDCADVALDFGGRGGVEDFGQRRLELTPGVEEDDGRGAEGGPVVGAGAAGDESDGDSDEGEQRGDGVAEVMPGVDAHGGALDGAGDGEDVAREEQLDAEDDEQDPEGVGPGQRVGRADEGDAFDGDGEGGAGHGKTDDRRGEGFGFAVAVGMGFVGRAERDAEADVNDAGAEDVGEGFDAVGKESEGMADEARDDFGEGEEEVGNDAQARGVESAMNVEFDFGGGGHGRALRSFDCKRREGENRE